MGRKKVRQSLTFDPELDRALRAMYEVVASRQKVKTLTYNGYLEGILSAHITRRFGRIPSEQEIRDMSALSGGSADGSASRSNG